MKIQNLSLKNFKKFQEKHLDFCDTETELAKDLIVLVGKNGSGKSSVLQAIAATLAQATGRLESPAHLKWPGFDWQLVNAAWPAPLEIELQVSFSSDEILATQEYFERTPQALETVRPAASRNVTLKLDTDNLQVTTENSSELYQFRGRDYAHKIVKNAKEGFALFKRVGTVFWYTEHRTTNSLTPFKENGQEIQFNMDLLRRRLSDLMGFHERIQRGEWQLQQGQRDIYVDLAKAYQTVFPNRRFYGPAPRANIDEVLAEPWFYLFDGNSPYELGEMSGGERAIFPILLDFANWNIHNSVILIDELELHLHPPLQQGLLRALRHLGDNNQFLVTTHSDAIAAVTPKEALYRLEA
jgi:predicted ATP-dependent endonuclease of OLD family